MALALASGARAGREECAPGRFLLPDSAAPLVAGGASGDHDAITLASAGAGHTVAIDSGCLAAVASVKTTRKGTKVRARWAACGTDRKLKLNARIGLDCTTMRVKFKVAGAKARRADAVRSGCGDGRVDTLGGEECEGAGDCASAGTCVLCECQGSSTSSTFPSSTTTTTLPGPTGSSSYDLIDAALAAGHLDEETAHKYRVFAAFNDSRLPAEYRGEDTRSGEPTNQLAAARAAFDGFSSETKSDLAPFFMRPDESGSWITLPTVGGQALFARSVAAPVITWQTFPAVGGKVKVWAQDRYAGDAAKAQAVALALTARIWSGVADVMSPPGPVSDVGLSNNGGDGALDIYLVHAPLDANGDKDWLGLCDYADMNQTCEQSPRFLLLDSDEPLGSDTTSGMLQTCAHELFHAFAAARTYATGCLYPEYSWINEASATWIEDHVYPLAQSEQDYVSAFLPHPKLSLDDTAQEHEYGAYLFPFYLVRSAGVGGESIVSGMWDAFASQPSLAGIDVALLTGTGFGFADTWPLFTLHNWNTEPVRDYFQWDDVNAGADYDGIALPASGTVSLPLGLPYLSARHFDVVPAAEAGVVVFENSIADEFPFGAAVWGIPQIAGQWQTPVDWTYEPQVGWCRDLPGEHLDELLLTFSNGDWFGKSTLQTTTMPKLRTSLVGCRPWDGLASATLTYDGTAVLTSSDIPVRFEPSQPQNNLANGIVSPLVSVGAGEWTASGTLGDCTVSGTVQIDPATADGFLNVYIVTNTYAGAAGAGVAAGQTFTLSCPGGSFPWLPDEGMSFFRTGFPENAPVVTTPGGTPILTSAWSGDVCITPGACAGTFSWSVQQLSAGS